MWIIQRQMKARTVRNKREKMELINVVLESIGYRIHFLDSNCDLEDGEVETESS